MKTAKDTHSDYILGRRQASTVQVCFYNAAKFRLHQERFEIQQCKRERGHLLQEAFSDHRLLNN